MEAQKLIQINFVFCVLKELKMCNKASGENLNETFNFRIQVPDLQNP